MHAVVTRGTGVMESTERADPAAPEHGHVVVRPEAVGVCGSDHHFLSGDLVTPPEFGAQYPRVQGHEVCGSIEAVGAGCPPHLQVGQRVAVWPLSSCGRCYACGIGRNNACPNFRLIGIHVDGALQERFVVDAGQVFPVGDLDPVPGAFCEPMSIAVHALERGRVTAGEHVVVLGAGPVGQAVSIAAQDRGAKVLMTDLVGRRLDLGRLGGAETIDISQVAKAADVAPLVRDWCGGVGPPVVLDCTGEPSAISDAVDMILPAGRVVIVGISHKQVPLPVNAFTEREIDLLGSSVCTSDDFSEAIRIVKRHEDRVTPLITHRSPLADAAEAVDHAMRHPDEVMKLVITTTW